MSEQTSTPEEQPSEGHFVGGTFGQAEPHEAPEVAGQVEHVGQDPADPDSQQDDGLLAGAETGDVETASEAQAPGERNDPV